METKRDEGRASQRDYTPHEHEELRAIAERARERLQLVSPAETGPVGHPPYSA
jgi:cell division protein FtsB